MQHNRRSPEAFLGGSKWSELPLDLLEKVARILNPSPVDVVRFRSVCHLWRFSTPSPYDHHCDNRHLFSRIFPMKIPVPPFFFKCLRPEKGFFTLTAARVCIIQPKEPRLESYIGFNYANDLRLIFAEELIPGKLCFRYPISVKNCKLFSNDPNTSRRLNLLDFHVRKFCHGEFYSLRFVVPHVNCCDDHGSITRGSESWKDFSEKAILLPNSNINNMSDPDYNSTQFGALVLFSDGKLALLKFRTIEWELIYDGRSLKCSDIVKIENNIYVLDQKGAIYVSNYDQDSDSVVQMKTIAYEVSGSRDRRKRVVYDPASNDLFLIARRGDGFIIYKLNKEEEKWVKVKSIGDRIFFISHDASYCADSEKDFKGALKGDYVFFGKNSFGKYQSERILGELNDDFDVDSHLFSGYDIAVYDLKEKTARGFPRDIDYRQIFDTPPDCWLKAMAS